MKFIKNNILNIPPLWSMSSKENFDNYCKCLIILDVMKKFPQIHIKRVDWNVHFGMTTISYIVYYSLNEKPNLVVSSSPFVDRVYLNTNPITPYTEFHIFKKK